MEFYPVSMVFTVCGISDSVWGIPLRDILHAIIVCYRLQNGGIKMAKGKSKDKRYRIIIQVGVWNKDYTRVYRYERQTLLVSAKNPQKAIQKVSVRGTILKVIAG